MSQIGNTCWVVLLGILFLQAAVHIANAIFQFYRSSPRRRLQSAFMSLRPKLSPAQFYLPDPAALHKAKRIEDALVKRGRKTFSFLSYLLTLVAGKFLIKSVMSGPLDARNEPFSLYRAVIFLAILSLSTVVLVRPTVLRPATLPYVYIFFMVCSVLYSAFKDECVEYVTGIGLTLLLNVFLGSLWMYFPLIMLGNTLAVIIQTMIYAQLVSNDASCIRSWKWSGIVSFQIFNLIIILLASWVACQFTELAVEWEIDKRSDQCFRDGFLSLLKSICDATVELDSTARLVEDSPALSHMILQRDGASLRGSTLDKWFRSPTEMATFKELIRNVILEDGQPRTTTMHCDLRSDLGVRIPVEMHIVHFLQIDGTLHHLLGIKEEPEFQPIHPLPDIKGRNLKFPSNSTSPCESSLSFDGGQREFLHPLPDIMGRSLEFPSNSTSPCESSLSSDGGQREGGFHTIGDFQIIDPNAAFSAMCHNAPLGCNAFDRKSFGRHLVKWIRHESKKVLEKDPEPWSQDLQMKVSNIASQIVTELNKIPANTDSVALEVFSDFDVVYINFLPHRKNLLKHSICIYLQLRVPRFMRM